VKQIVMAITGASGAPYAQRLAQQIVNSGAHLHLVVSPAGRKLLFDELGLRQVTVAALAGRSVPNVTLYAYEDIGAKLASGSFVTDSMVICPCSSNRLASVASGLSDNLIDRAAAVTLKQARRLILVHREMPLSQIDIANMLRLSQAGAIICPASPGFYLLPKTVADLVDFVAGRVLDLLGVPHNLDIRWEPAASPRSTSAKDPHQTE
jgi:4-hydroxy-3-polyprenylbenzoate decarboxylase